MTAYRQTMKGNFEERSSSILLYSAIKATKAEGNYLHFHLLDSELSLFTVLTKTDVFISHCDKHN